MENGITILFLVIAPILRVLLTNSSVYEQQQALVSG